MHIELVTGYIRTAFRLEDGELIEAEVPTAGLLGGQDRLVSNPYWHEGGPCDAARAANPDLLEPLTRALEVLVRDEAAVDGEATTI